jgi:hypothetical protein
LCLFALQTNQHWDLANLGVFHRKADVIRQNQKTQNLVTGQDSRFHFFSDSFIDMDQLPRMLPKFIHKALPSIYIQLGQKKIAMMANDYAIPSYQVTLPYCSRVMHIDHIAAICTEKHVPSTQPFS